MSHYEVTAWVDTYLESQGIKSNRSEATTSYQLMRKAEFEQQKAKK